MKTKKILAVLLVAVMLFVPFTASVSAADVSIVSGPIKTGYNSSENFNPQGIIVSVDGTNIAYTPDNKSFSFVPGLDATIQPEVKVYYNGVEAGVVKVTVVSLASGPIKTVYNDSERFNPQGIVISADGKNIAYTPDNAKFTFIPGLDENIKTTATAAQGSGATQVKVFYNNIEAGVVTVTVSHIWGKVTYMDNNYHGQYCIGCGIVKETLPHNVPEYIPNDDGGLLIEQTETGRCADCGHDVTRNIPGSNKFNGIFNSEDGSLTDTEFGFLNVFMRLIIPLIQMLTGIQ